MKKCLLFLVAMFSFATYYGQTESLWKATENSKTSEIKSNKRAISRPNLFKLDLVSLKKIAEKAPNQNSTKVKSSVILSFPDSEGNMQNFSIFKTSNFSPELAAKFPEISSYYGESIDGKASKIYFSISPLGLYTIQLRLGKEAVFIESYDKKNTTYIAYKKSDKTSKEEGFKCDTKHYNSAVNGLSIARVYSADDGLLRKYRLALSCTAEYTQHFGGTKAQALAAMNNTMTRVNAVFMNDFAIKMELIPEEDNIIFTNASTDPYSDADTGSAGDWNAELMDVLHGSTYGIGDGKFDIGHLFGASGGGGSAGCIGCVCSNDITIDQYGPVAYKGSGYTSPADAIPSGDNFDIDYVAHEIGHQFGANHTFTRSSDPDYSYEGTGVQVEPGSGSTIMGYAGITSMDVQPHSDPYFHAVSIQQITEYIKSTNGNCSVNTNTNNSTPIANAGLDYIIPKSTPYQLTGSGNDIDNDVLSYNWEQIDNQNNSTAPNSTKTSGVNFRSYIPTSTPTRYFPKMSSILAGATTTSGSELTVEALSSVNRTLNFRLTVRDNKANGAANAYDDMKVTVNSTYGPFTVTSQSTTGISYPQGSSQTVTWSVASTSTLSANVDILISTDAGNSWTTLLADTPNDGTQSVTLPNILSTTCRFMVKASSSIFFNVNTKNFAISAPDTTPPTAPTLSASGTTSVSTVLAFTGATDNVGITAYDIYKDGALLTTVTASPFTVTGLTPSTTYNFVVKAKDGSGNVSIDSNSVSVTTQAPDTIAPTAPTLSAAGTTNNSTTLSWIGATDNVGVTAYEIYKDGALLTTVTASPYTVTGLTASTTYEFTIKAKDAAGNTSISSNSVNVTTSAMPAFSELYISEYYEGLSNNKFIEISNPTGAAISLSNYSIKKQANGSGAWGNQLNLTGTIAANSTLVLRNSNSTLTSCSFSSQSVTNAPLDFNGNDPIALFKDTTLIDVVGTFGNTSNFAVDTNLRRNLSVPNATFTISEWDSYSITSGNPNCSNIGILNPVQNLATGDVKDASRDFILLPNPVKGDIIYVRNVKESSDYIIFDASGKILSKGKLSNGSASVKSLSVGVYYLKINQTVKRFIKQ